jgi:hypothetical protein
MNRKTILAFALFASFLLVTALPVTASHGQLAVGSEHSDDQELGAGTLTDTVISGTGESASVELKTGTSTYSIVDDEGDGTAESERTFIGDRSDDNVLTRGVWLQPDTSGTISNVTLNIVGISGGEYSTTVDIYLVKEKPDGTFGEGTLVKSGYSPSWTTGDQTIEFDTNSDVSAGENYTLAFETQSTNNDGQTDALVIGSDEDSGLTGPWMETELGQTREWPADVSVPIDASGETGQYISPNHSISSAVNGWTNLTLTNTTATVEWQAWNTTSDAWQVVNSSTYSSTGNYTLDIAETSFETWRVNVTFDKTGSNPTAQLHDEGILVETSSPSVDDSSLSPNTTSETSESTSITLEANVTDPDFGRSQGDELTAEWYVDGNIEGTTTVTSNGTASYTLDSPTAGEHDWHVEFTDQYGHTVSSATASFVMPSELRIYKENATGTLVDTVTVELEFYGASNETFNVQRSTSNGKINMTGLPADEEFVVVAKADDYYNRRIYVSSLVETQSVYVLPKGQKAVYNVFTLTDRSGTYPAGETRLIVQRALNISGSLEWRTIAGDFFGATNRFPVYLSYNQRYRLIIENSDGDRRVIGAYTATDEDNPKPIIIKSIVVRPPNGQDYYGTGWVEDDTKNDGEKSLRFSYADSSGQTSDLNLLVYERGNRSNEIVNTTVADPGTEWAYSYTLKESRDELGKAYVVEWSASRNGQQIGAEFPVGDTGGLPIPMDPEWLARFAFVAIPVVGAMAGERVATLAAMGLTAFVGVLMVAGIWHLPVVLWFAALIISVGGHTLTMAQRGAIFG